MADQNPTGMGAPEPPVPVADDLRDQAIVLGQVLFHWPIQLGLDDLAREIAADPCAVERGDRDRIERAVTDLAGAGLLHRCGVLVVPTRAALICSRLEGRL
jgi:hypothetical protein